MLAYGGKRGVSLGKDQGEEIMKYLRKDSQIFLFLAKRKEGEG